MKLARALGYFEQNCCAMLLQFLVVILVLLLIIDRWKPKNLVKLHKHLGNDFTYWPIFGHALAFMGSNEDSMKTVMQLTSQAFKRKHHTISMWLGNIFFVALTNGDQACFMLKSVLDKYYIWKFSKHLLGNGIVFGPVDTWHRRRKILITAFAPRYVNRFVSVFDARSKVLAELLESKVGKGDFSCYDYVCPYALDSVCETLFGLNVDIQRQPEHPFFKALRASFKNMALRMTQPWLHIDAIYKLLPMYTTDSRLTKTVHSFVDNLIMKKKALIDEKNGAGEQVDDQAIKTFLELLINNSNDIDKRYTDEELREETLALAAAGSDTTAVGTCFTILLLSQHMDVQDKVYREIQEVLGDTDKTLEAEDLIKLKYLKAVLKESLRLYPPVPLTIRYLKNNIDLPTGINIPNGCNVVSSIWSIHRNPHHWGEDANVFNPDRFLSGKVPPSNAFIPFSHGPRNCPGHQYAMYSMTTTLVTLLRRYRFKPATHYKYDENNPLRTSFEIMLIHADNFSVQIEYRNKPNKSI